MTEVTTKAEKSFSSVLSNPAIDLFNEVPTGLWMKARQILDHALGKANSIKNTQLKGYDLTGQEQESLDKALKDLALKLMEFHANEAAHTVLSRMKDKFSNSFSLDENRMPRTWTAKDDLSKISRTARFAAAEVLAQLAVSQSEKESSEALKIEHAILQMVRKDLDLPKESSGDSKEDPKGAEIDVMVVVEWTGVDSKEVLIDPPEVRSIWKQFMSDTKMQITQASMTQMANKLASNRAPPIWAIVAMLILGFDEFMAVLYSPVLAITLILFVLFCRSLYIELDVDNEIQKGALPGAMALAAKFVPGVKSVSSKTLESISGFFDQGEGQGTTLEASEEATPPRDGASSSSEAQKKVPEEAGKKQQSITNESCVESEPERDYPAVMFEPQQEENSKDK